MSVKGNQKLRSDEVICIRALKPTTSAYRLGKEFGISRRAVMLIVNGVNYKYLPLNPEVNFCLLPLKKSGVRTCYVCKDEFPLTLEFFHRKGNGFQYGCRTCVKRQTAENHLFERQVFAEEKLLNTQIYA